MKILFFATLAIILTYSAISMAKPGFYLLSDLHTPQQIEMELGPPHTQKVFAQSQVYMYRGGMVKPLCIEYEMTFVKGLLSTWTWSLCR